MKIPPWILGVSALVPIAGAVAGASISTDPIGVGASVTDTLPQGSPITVADARPQMRDRLPDHYPMMTPDGLVEVHELSLRGRHRDQWQAARQYQDRYEADLAALESRWADDAPDSRAARALDAAQPYVPSRDRFAYASPAKPAPTEPLDLAEPQDVTAEQPVQLAVASIEPVRPRVIDVAVELASR